MSGADDWDRTERVTVPYFGGAEVELLWLDLGPDDLAARAALARFLALTHDARARDERHLWAYYLDVTDGAAGASDPGGAAPATPSDLWALVTPTSLGFMEREGALHVMLEAACAWEREHGLLMVWRNGDRLVKLGPYDGHATNAAAYADPRLHDVVYAAARPDLTTRRDDDG